ILSHVYEDISIFNAREAALNDITELLLAMQAGLDRLQVQTAQRVKIGGEIGRLIDTMDNLVAAAKHRAMPLLSPAGRVAPYPVRGRKMNLADIVFLVHRGEWMKKDAHSLARNVNLLVSALSGAGLDLRFGVQPYESYSQSSGPLRENLRGLLDDLDAIYFNGEVRNTLSAVAQVVGEQAFRQDAHRFIVLVSDGNAHDDFGTMREDAMAALRGAGATLISIGVNNPHTGRPYTVCDDMATATGGKSINYETVPMEKAVEELVETIREIIMRRGAATYESDDREFQIGPGAEDTFSVRFPDYRPETLGLSDLPLEKEEDFRTAVQRIQTALDTVTDDRAEKTIIHNYLNRILSFFDELRVYKLDLHY
ncbi:VWA domain-containing protein, partial [bacterium]